MDPALGSWWQNDPLAEKFYPQTPYNVNFNNPILMADPMGDCPPGTPDCVISTPFVSEIDGAPLPQQNRTYVENKNEIAIKTEYSYYEIGSSDRVKIEDEESYSINVSQVNSTNISRKSVTTLFEIMRSSEEHSMLITSLGRNAKDQARIMYNNSTRYGVEGQYKMYAEPGDKVIDVYVQMKTGNAVNNIANLLVGGTLNDLHSPEQIKKAMEDKINELGPNTVSKHTMDPSILQVFDVAPSSLSSQVNFKNALDDVLLRTNSPLRKYIRPGGGEKAFHIEVKQ